VAEPSNESTFNTPLTKNNQDSQSCPGSPICAIPASLLEALEFACLLPLLPWQKESLNVFFLPLIQRHHKGLAQLLLNIFCFLFTDPDFIQFQRIKTSGESQNFDGMGWYMVPMRLLHQLVVEQPSCLSKLAD